MSISNHIKEHIILGLPEFPAAQFDGVQKTTATGYHAITMGGKTANYSTINTAFYLFPFILPENKNKLTGVAAYFENNGATLMDTAKYAVWDAKGNLLSSGTKPIGSPTIDGAKFVMDDALGVIIPTRSFWFGFGLYDDSANAWIATELRARDLVSAQGAVGVDSSTGGFGSPRNAALILSSPSVAIPDPLLGAVMQDLPAPADSSIFSVVAAIS